jgi:predicted kinase
MTRLILLIGVPGSGKSFWVEQRCQTHDGQIVISTDAIRAELFGDEAVQGAWLLVWQTIQQRFELAVEQINQGQALTAIYDATNARRRNRRQAIALAHSTGFSHITGVWFDVPLWLCLERNQRRSRRVPDEVLQRMQRQLMGAPPDQTEGMDCLIRLTDSAPAQRGDRTTKSAQELESSIN